jgi:CubicO group peptidase (beta-lactamase class C family)
MLIPVLLILNNLFLAGQSSFTEENQGLESLYSDHQLMGVSAAYSIDNKIIWQHSMGYADQENTIPFTERTLNRTASIAKPMTAIAIMQLVENGQIDLDVPIQTYLPNYPTKKKGTITVRHLLTHSSGIDAYKNAKEAETQKEYPTLTDATEVFSKRKLKFTPGTDFFYTTYGYVVLGLIIEVVSGLSYEEYMKQNIWDKVGMASTGVEKYNVNYTNKSQLFHHEKGKTRLGKKNNLSSKVPGGGIYSTVEDLLKFGNGVVNNTFVKAATLEQMIEVNGLKKDGNPYGFGWFLYGPAPHQNVVIGHSGEQTGVSSQLMIIPKSKTVVVVLSNTSGKWKEVIQYSGALIGLSEKGKKKN